MLKLTKVTQPDKSSALSSSRPYDTALSRDQSEKISKTLKTLKTMALTGKPNPELNTFLKNVNAGNYNISDNPNSVHFRPKSFIESPEIIITNSQEQMGVMCNNNPKIGACYDYRKDFLALKIPEKVTDSTISDFEAYMSHELTHHRGGTEYKAFKRTLEVKLGDRPTNSWGALFLIKAFNYNADELVAGYIEMNEENNEPLSLSKLKRFANNFAIPDKDILKGLENYALYQNIKSGKHGEEVSVIGPHTKKEIDSFFSRYKKAEAEKGIDPGLAKYLLTVDPQNADQIILGIENKETSKVNLDYVINTATPEQKQKLIESGLLKKHRTKNLSSSRARN